MVAITRSGRYYLTAFGVAFLLGLAFGNFNYLLVGLFLVGFLLVGMRMSMPAGILVHRTVSHERTTVGKEIEVRVEATIAKGGGFVILHDRLPSMFDLVNGNNTHLVWKGAVPKQVSYTYRFKCTKRGGYTLSGTQALGLSALGLTEAVVLAEADPLEVVVEPRVLKVRQVKPMRGKARTIFPSGDRARAGTRTNEFSEVREYTRGDPLKSVNWKATAKASTDDLSLMVNEYEVEGKKSVWFFIDAADYMEVGSTLSNTFDQTVEAALEILEHFISRGYRVGGTVFNTAGDEHEAPVFYPEHGRSQYIKVVKELTGLTTSSHHEGLAAAVERVRGFLARERPLVLLVTRPEGDYEGTTLGIKRILAHTGTDRRTKTPIMMVAPQVRSVAAESQDVSDLALVVAEHEAAVTNKQLRRMGVTLIEWDPGHSSVAAVLSRGVRTR